MKAHLPIEVDPEIMSGAPVQSSRISTPHPEPLPVRGGEGELMSLDEVLDCFPTVKREDAIVVLEHSKAGLLQEIHA